MKRILIISVLFTLSIPIRSYAQDPDFSQFFISQQLLNPASVGTGYGDFRLMMNFRRMWANASTPYNTGVINLDYKLLKNRDTKNILAAGLSVLGDESLYGALKNIYTSGSIAFHGQLTERDRLGGGLQVSYGNRSINKDLLTFGEQFASGGFNTSLPSGEALLSSNTNFISLGLGAWYNYSTTDFNFDFGGALFHVNKPKQSLLNDENQFLPMRMVLHSNIEYSLSASLLLSGNTVFMRQAGKNSFSIGSALGFDLGEGDRRNVLFAGAWYKAGASLYPYLGLLYERFQIGFTYDVTVSKQTANALNPNSFEFSLIFKQAKPIPGVIPCPYK